MPIPLKPVPALQMVPRGLRFFRVTAAAAVTASNDANGNPTQWTYTVQEVYKSGLGYGTWTARAKEFAAYSFAEDMNDGSGVQGNGVNHDGTDYLAAAFDMSPIPVGSILPGTVVRAPDGIGGMTEEVWLLYGPNGEDGNCA